MPEIGSFFAERPLIIAHRGASDVAPENTLAAFEAAIEAGADGVELDVTRCATGEIVVIHDDTVDRTTNGSGQVSGLPFYALRELDAGSWSGSQYAGQRVPTLQEVLDLLLHRARVNIEIKSDFVPKIIGRNLRGDGLEEEIAELIRSRSMQQEVILSSFNPAALVRASRAAPEIPRGLLYAPDLPLYLAKAWSLPLVRPQALHPHHSLVTDKYVAWARRHGLRIAAWTVDDPEEMCRMAKLSVDAIITNHPGKLRRVLDETCPTPGV